MYFLAYGVLATLFLGSHYKAMHQKLKDCHWEAEPWLFFLFIASVPLWPISVLFLAGKSFRKKYDKSLESQIRKQKLQLIQEEKNKLLLQREIKALEAEMPDLRN